MIFSLVSIKYKILCTIALLASIFTMFPVPTELSTNAAWTSLRMGGRSSTYSVSPAH